MKLSKEAIKLLKKTRDYILAEPRRLNMSEWLNKGAVPGMPVNYGYETGMVGMNSRKILDEKDAPPCGTVGCIAGWVSVLGKKEIEKNGLDVFTVERQAEHLLGLDLPLGELFHPDQWPKHYSEYKKAKTAKRRAKIVAKVIDEYIEKYS